MVFSVCVVSVSVEGRRQDRSVQCTPCTAGGSKSLISKQPACRPLAWTVDTPAPAPARRNAP